MTRFASANCTAAISSLSYKDSIQTLARSRVLPVGVMRAVAFLLVSVAAAATAVYASGVGWTSAADGFPLKQWGITAVSTGELAFFAGGSYDNENGDSRVDIYNSTDGVWSNSSFALGSNTNPFLFGAFVARKVVFAAGDATGYVYDLDTRVWSSVPNALSSARSNGRTCVSGTKALFFGGNGGASYSRDLDEYNGATNTWTVRSSLPITSPVRPIEIGRTYVFGRAGSNPGKCVVAGGMDGSNAYIDIVDVYDVGSDSWGVAAVPLHTKRLSPSDMSIGGYYFVIGGWDESNQPLASVEYYDPNSNSMIVSTLVLNVPRFAASTGYSPDGNLIFFAGGAINKLTASEFVATNVIEYYNISSQRIELSAATLGTARYLIGVAAAGSKLLFVDGDDGNYVATTVVDTYESSYCAGVTACQNAGTCVSGLNAFSCQCGPNWSGQFCTIPVPHSSSAQPHISSSAAALPISSSAAAAAVASSSAVPFASASAAASAAGASTASSPATAPASGTGADASTAGGGGTASFGYANAHVSGAAIAVGVAAAAASVFISACAL